jgi:hypothetical protein
MSGRTDLSEASPRPTGHGLRLWHLAATVLGVALMLGGLVALKREAMVSGIGGPLVWGVMAVFATTCFGSARIGTKVTRGPLKRLRRWGLLRGGVAGFIAWLFSAFADATILVGSVAVGLTAAFGLVWLVLIK